MMLSAHKSLRGFTLIELVMVIVITGIVATMVSSFIRAPIDGYMDLTRRAELVDAAESALRLMARDIRRALPNSIRVTGSAIEMINTLDAGRYRLDPPGNAATRLEFNKLDTDFDVVGGFNNIAKPLASAADQLVVYNLGSGGADAYSGNVITPVGTTITITDIGDDDHVNLSAGYQFAFESPSQRIFLTDGAISYYCANSQLLRNGPYAIAATQPTTPSGTTVTAHLTGCNFTYNPGTASRAALVTLDLTLSDGGESIRLIQQVHVDNVP